MTPLHTKPLTLTVLQLHTWNCKRRKVFDIVSENECNDYDLKNLPSREIQKEIVKIYHKIYKHDLVNDLTVQNIRDFSSLIEII